VEFGPGDKSGIPFVVRGRKRINAKPEYTGELSKATQQIHGLLEELTSTVESAERLTRIGEPERALRLVEEQRESLFNTVDTISRAVSVRRSSLDKLRTRTPLLVAVALGVVSVLAGAVAALTISATPPAQARLRQAERIADPATRMNAIYATYRDVAKSDPKSVAPGTALNHDVTTALTKTKADMQSDPTKAKLVDQAKTLIDAVSRGQTPPPPPTPTPPPTPAPLSSPGTSNTSGLPPLPR
jgi:hypothetical protein